jgi:hypothetical protein
MSKPLFLELRSTSIALVGAVALCSCGGGSDDGGSNKGSSSQDCSAIVPTLSQGLYGCITQTNDVGTPSTGPLANFTVNLYPESVAAPAAGGGEALASAKSNRVGFYEMPAIAGSYWLCTSFFRCTPVTLAAGEKKRRDYDFGVGPGWWSQCWSWPADAGSVEFLFRHAVQVHRALKQPPRWSVVAVHAQQEVDRVAGLVDNLMQTLPSTDLEAGFVPWQHLLGATESADASW